jgi:hypothetical protein
VQIALGVIAAIGAATFSVGGLDVPWVLPVALVLVVVWGAVAVWRWRRGRRRVRFDRLTRLRDDLMSSTSLDITNPERLRILDVVAPFSSGSGAVPAGTDLTASLSPPTAAGIVRRRVLQRLDTVIDAVQSGLSAGTYRLPR